MDGMEDIALQRKDLREIRNRLYECHDSLRELEIQAGEVARRMVDGGVAKSEIARRLGVSAPHVATLIQRAEEEKGMDVRPVTGLVPMLSPGEVVEYLAESGRSVRRVIAGFSESDVLFYSGLEPECFDAEAEPGRMIRVPGMLLRTDSGRWLGVDGCNVGYGGTGPTNSHDLLRELGVGEDLAYRAFTCRFVDLDLLRGDHLPPTGNELYGLSLPKSEGPVYAVRLGVEDLRGTRDHEDEAAREARSTTFREASSVERGLSRFERWIEYLDDEEGLPPWLSSPRVGRLFLSAEEALDHGFGYSSKRFIPHSRGPAYRLIIEQGRLQIWLPFHQPMDRTQILPQEAYLALAYAGLYPLEIAQLDERSSLARYLDRMVGRRQPGYVDVSREGNRTISYIPAQERPPRR